MKKILFLSIEYYNKQGHFTGKTSSVQEMPFLNDIDPVKQYTNFIETVQTAYTQHRGNGEETLVVGVSHLQDAS